jgi:Protein of unknown function (DUF3995)
MFISLAILLLVLFLALAVLHLYWAVGGSWGIASVVPQRSATNPAKLFQPTWFSCSVVAVGLVGFAAVVWLYAFGWAGLAVPWAKVALQVVLALFFLRAVGDFRYAGCFKKVRGTQFSQADDRLFTPLCIGVAGLLVVLLYV